MSKVLGRLDPRQPARERGARLTAADLDARCAGLSGAVAGARGRLPEGPVRAAEGVLARASERRALAADLSVVALAGATGAGKSTLFNALVGQEVARVAVTRPTTAEPLAALWTSPAHAGGLLEWLGVPRWHVMPGPQDGAGDDLDGLVLLDLPDHDSTQLDHRAQVDHLVQRVDAMVWVLDPQKYADAVVHDAYLRRFATHADVTVVLLNQVDQLAPADAEACLAHLRSLVDADGLGRAQVLGVSARTGQGLAEVRALLGQVVRSRAASLQRIAADVVGAAAGLQDAAQDAGTTIRPVPEASARELNEALADAAGVALVEQAVGGSVRLRGVRATGWLPTRWLHHLRRDPAARLRLGRAGVDPALVRTSLPSASPVALARATQAARDYAAAASAGAPDAWVRSTRVVAVDAADALGPDLDAAVARAEVAHPRTPRWWSLAGAVQWLFLGVAALGALWLLGLVALRALALAPPEPPTVGGLPVPTVLLLGGLLVGLVLAMLAGLAVRGTANRAARRARARVIDQVAQVAQARIVEPVSVELGTLAEFRVGIAAARGQ
ncbi:MAG TPA: GTPase [Candidatus Nanopelagicales bacterium]